MIKGIIKNLDELAANSQRARFLFDRMMQDAKELYDLGLTIDIDNAPCELNDNFGKIEFYE